MSANLHKKQSIFFSLILFFGFFLFSFFSFSQTANAYFKCAAGQVRVYSNSSCTIDEGYNSGCANSTEYRCNGNNREKRTVIRTCNLGCKTSVAAACSVSYTVWSFSESCGTSKYCAGVSPNAVCQACAVNMANCDQSVSNGCEINLSNNNNNCGSCGHACTNGDVCTGGFCSDTIPPVFTSFTVFPSSGWTKDNPVWSWLATDNSSGMRQFAPYYVFLDGANAIAGNITSYQPTAPLSSGTHQVSVDAYDNAGNVVHSGNLSANVDNLAPSATFGASATIIAQGRTITLSITAVDSHSGVSDICAHYKNSWHCYDCGGSNSCNNTWSFTESSPGEFIYTGYVSDVLGNGNYTSPNQIIVNVIDQTPPVVSITGAPVSWQNSDATAQLVCNDAGVGCNVFEYYLKTFSSNPGNCSGQTYTFSHGSSATVSSHLWACAKAEDKSGNVGYSPVVEFKVDRIDPDTPNIDSPVNGSTLSADFPVSVSGDNDSGGSGIDKCYYSVHDSVAGFTKSRAERPCNGLFTVTVGAGKDCQTSHGTCSVYVFNKDAAGNESGQRSRTFITLLDCVGNVILELDRGISSANNSVLATVSGLDASDCNYYGAEILIGSGEKVGSCSVLNGSCQDSIVLVSGSYQLYARIDKNRDGDFNDSGETSAGKDLLVVATEISCYTGTSNGCGYIGFSEYPSQSGSWLGMCNEVQSRIVDNFMWSLFIPGSSLVDSCDNCQVASTKQCANGGSCYLVDTCSYIGGSPASLSSGYNTYSVGKWDNSAGQCITCNGVFQNKLIMEGIRRCYDISNCGSGWSESSCANSIAKTCESACGAASACDERLVDAVWTATDGKKYKCNSQCQRVEALAPISKITGPDPGPAWYSNDIEVSVVDEDRSGTGLEACYYTATDLVTGIVQVGERECNGLTHPITIGSLEIIQTCSTEGWNKCEVKVWACDNSALCINCDMTHQCSGYQFDPYETLSGGGYSNRVYYNIDHSAPQINH